VSARAVTVRMSARRRLRSVVTVDEIRPEPEIVVDGVVTAAARPRDGAAVNVVGRVVVAAGRRQRQRE